METLITVLGFIDSCLRKVLLAVTSLPGLIISAVVGVFSFVGSLFSRFSWTTTITDWVNSASTSLDYVLQFVDDGGIGSICVRFLALDQLALSAVSLFGLTVGVLTLCLVTFVSSLFLLASSVLAIRGTLKLIHVASAGFLKP